MNCFWCINKNLIFGHVNNKSVHNKFESWCSIIEGSIYITMKAKTKFDERFLQLNFFLNQFCPPDRLDRNGYKGEILVYVGQNVTLVLSLKSFCLHFIIKSKIKNPQCFKNSANHLALIFFSQIVLIHCCAQPLLKVLALSHCWKLHFRFSQN